MKKDITIRIPLSAKAGIISFIELPKEKKDSLLEILKSIRPCLDLSDIENNIASKLEMEKEKVSEILDILLHFSMFQYSMRMTGNEVINNIIKAIKILQQDLLEDMDELSEFKIFLEEFLNLDHTASVISKAMFLESVNEKNLLGSRILTDLRPIFFNNVNEAPTNFLVIHHLILEYFDENRIKKTIISTDKAGLLRIQEDVDRALRKEEGLDGLCKQKNIELLNKERGE